MRWTAPLHQHRNVPIIDSDSPAADALLAFAERQLLAEAVEELSQRQPWRNEWVKIEILATRSFTLGLRRESIFRLGGPKIVLQQPQLKAAVSGHPRSRPVYTPKRPYKRRCSLSA